MTRLNRIRRALLALLLAGTAAGAQAAGPLAAGSLYASGAALTDQSGRVFHLADLRGEPVLVSMFYSSCSMVCPMIFETIRATLDKGGKSARDGVRVLMITVDPERDSVAVLKKTAADHGADDRWQLARADSSGTRSIAALLGVQYRRLADGDFNHSSTIVLLDAQGRINARTNTLGATDPKLVQAMRKLLGAER
ncbi:SCO family protein [Ralstonia pseudosolanacearum]|uniref:SCO family protein n=1 Tax=Ralstonia pseudosolanacearum TaxID=1310165 RepID=UPI000B92E73D|nr:SCO family protein [Ralstonia pseudosolanacearum]MCD9231076.1 SCO family protein [Ralstonia pseudosolanacearum]